MKRILVYISFIFILIMTIVLGMFFSSDLQKDLIKQKKVELYPLDKRFIKDEEVLSLLNFKDSVFGKLSVDKIEQKLLTNPYVSNAEVYIDLNNHLYAYVEQYQPIARVIGSKSYYIDREGKTRPLSKHYTENVLLIFGNLNNQKQKEIYRLVKKINSDEILSKIVTEIHVKSDNYYLRTKDLASEIEFGTMNEADEKFEKLKAIYLYLTKHKFNKKYHQLNLTYHNQVVCN